MAPLPNPAQAVSAIVKPTRSLVQAVTKTLVARQETTTVVAETNNGGNNLSGGEIAGIVIGSIVGFLLILWIIRSCTNLGNPALWGNTFGSRDELPASKGVEPTYVRQSGPRSSRHHHRSRSRHSHYDRSPRRSVEVRNVSTTRPVYYERSGRSPKPPQPVYYARDTRESRREGRGRRSYYG
ncbi:hypothetical protein BJ170DRAFT_596282 [Xylariales sp. AK1849]|nr:hypothetical protein BJ170DRAFT_596282 [Xylariales sp. AK1849]